MITNTADYKLKTLRIEFKEYGEYKGKYVGTIAFENGVNEAFMFNLSPEKTAQYLELVSEELVKSASSLGEKLLQSMNLLPAPTDKLSQIEEAIIQP